ncbi:unnamed protein product [Allacma fusca]|uniref:Uncharacterized protein n=1 Tax=Allacma fusca TaxID=39272 RepID=A0A8J2NMC8_9HEXA|nr:unnamed protein product [Allacma fusca]
MPNKQDSPNRTIPQTNSDPHIRGGHVYEKQEQELQLKKVTKHTDSCIRKYTPRTFGTFNSNSSQVTSHKQHRPAHQRYGLGMQLEH